MQPRAALPNGAPSPRFVVASAETPATDAAAAAPAPAPAAKGKGGKK